MTNALAHNQQAATQDSTSTGTQARYKGYFTGPLFHTGASTRCEHLVCLGVVRRLLLYCKGPVGPIHVRLGSKVVAELSYKLTAFASTFPVSLREGPVQ